jgi:hypothetical protein
MEQDCKIFGYFKEWNSCGEFERVDISHSAVLGMTYHCPSGEGMALPVSLMSGAQAMWLSLWRMPSVRLWLSHWGAQALHC